MSSPVVVPGEVGDVPAARSIRRFTAAAGRTRAGASLGELLGNLYYAVISFAISGGVAVGVAQALHTSLPPAPDVAPSSLSLPTLAALVLLAAVGVLVSLAGRLGPVGAGGAEAAWWLGLPVERRGLLRPAVRRVALVGAVAGAVVVALLDAALLGDGPGVVARSTVAGGLVAAVVVLAAGVAQSLGLARRRVALLGDLLLAGVGLLAVALGAAGAHLAALPTPSWPVAAGAVLVVGALAWFLDRRLGAIPASSLREGGSVASQAVGAVVSLDSRELGRALSVGTAAPARRRRSRLRLARGPVSALLAADVALLRRSPRHVVQIVLAALVPVLATVVPQLSGVAGVLLTVLAGGSIAASATAEGARYGEMVPVLDRVLPLAAKTTRRLRMVVPAAVMLVWSLVVFAALGRWAGSTAGWLALAIAATPVWAAAAVRAAYRPAPDWNKPLVSTPMGALPTGVLGVVARGPDLVVLCLVPTWIAILLRSTTPGLLVVQLALSAVAVLVASSTSTESWFDRLSRVMDEQSKANGTAGSRR